MTRRRPSVRPAHPVPRPEIETVGRVRVEKVLGGEHDIGCAPLDRPWNFSAAANEHSRNDDRDRMEQERFHRRGPCVEAALAVARCAGATRRWIRSRQLRPRHTAATLRCGDPDEPRTRTRDVRPQAATQHRSGNAERLVAVRHSHGKPSTGAMKADVNFTLDEGPLLSRTEPDEHLLEAVGIVGTELEPGEENRTRRRGRCSGVSAVRQPAGSRAQCRCGVSAPRGPIDACPV